MRQKFVYQIFAVEKKAVSGVVGYRELCIFALSFN
jgi:hypothetical protein